MPKGIKAGSLSVPKPTPQAKPKISFSFEHLSPHSYSDCKDAEFFIKFLERMKKLCCLDWITLHSTHRHSFGLENIPIGQLKKQMEIRIEDDHLLVLRATGDNHVFLGFRKGDVFNVVFIEAEFGDIYNHGKKK